MSNSHNDISEVIAPGSGEEDSDGVGSSLKRSSCKSAVRIALELGGKVAELEDGVIESQHSELGSVILSDEGRGRKGRTEEVLAFTALLREADQ